MPVKVFDFLKYLWLKGTVIIKPLKLFHVGKY